MYPSYSAYSYQGWAGGGQLTQNNPDDPGAASPQYWSMAHKWTPVADVLGGNAGNARQRGQVLTKAVQ